LPPQNLPKPPPEIVSFCKTRAVEPLGKTPKSDSGSRWQKEHAYVGYYVAGRIDREARDCRYPNCPRRPTGGAAADQRRYRFYGVVSSWSTNGVRETHGMLSYYAHCCLECFRQDKDAPSYSIDRAV
jgi:hypothetical protein